MGVKIVGDGGRRRVVTKGGGVFKGKKGREKGKNWREERTKKKSLGPIIIGTKLGVLMRIDGRAK